jgi:hypothetical protein
MISSTKMREYLKSDKRDFKMFPIKFTDSESNAINNLSITNFDNFDYYGNLDLMDFKNFFQKIGENNLKNTKIIEKIIKKITNKVLGSFEMDHFWISIRASVPNKSFDIPRWHYDGFYFSNIDTQPKFAFVLKGPGTLFIKSSRKVIESYNKIQDKSRKEYREILEKEKIDLADHKAQVEVQIKNNLKYRPKFAKELSKYKVRQVKNNQGVIFWGGKDIKYNALHSEPKIDAPRLFISILPGTKAMIEERENKQKKF